MSTVRVDPLTGQMVVVAPLRIPAPPDFGRGHLPEVARCPFCPENEHLTVQELGRREGEAGWTARAFPNRRPGVHLEASSGPIGTPLLQGAGGRGAHEVVVLGRTHGRLSLTERRHGLELAAERMADLAQDPRFAAIGWYRNRGREAGSSQPHDHAQILAMPEVPSRVAQIWWAQREDPDRIRRLVDAAEADDRLVLHDESVVAWCPWAPTAPFAVRIAPTSPKQDWREGPTVEALARALHRLVDALDGLSGFTSLNLVGTLPPPGGDEPAIRWLVEIVPRIVSHGGFELWSGGAMHPIDPVVAAAMLREGVA